MNACCRELIDTLPRATATQVGEIREELIARVPALCLDERYSLCGRQPVVPSSDADALPTWIREGRDQICGAGGIVESLLAVMRAASPPERIEVMGMVAGFMPLHRPVREGLEAQSLDFDSMLWSRAINEFYAHQFPRQMTLSLTLRCQLACPFCVSADLDQVVECQDMDVDNVERILDWGASAGVTRIGFSGGEPTLHPRFGEILDQVRQRDMELFLASNGLVSQECLRLLQSAAPLAVTFHLTDVVWRDSNAFDDWRKSVARLQSESTRVSLRYNLSSCDQREVLNELVAVAVDNRMHSLQVAVVLPNAARTNQHVATESLRDYAPLLNELARRCAERNVSVVLAKPFPLCLLDRDSAIHYMKSGSMNANCSVHQQHFSFNMVIYTDAHFSACLGLGRRSSKPIFDYGSLEEAAEKEYRGEVMHAIKQPFIDACRCCPLHESLSCIGGCLSYRLDEEYGT